VRESLTEILESAIARRVFPGAVVFLARGEAVFAHGSFGTTAYDAEYSRPVTTDTVYDLASLTKLFTTTAFLLAAREAGVGARTPLAQFLPEFEIPDKRAITLRNLLHHSSGIELAIQSLVHFSPSEWISKIAAAPLHAPCGEKVLYSCTNFFLLARVIEMLCRMPLDEFIAARVLFPLEMTRTTFYPRAHFTLDEIAPTEIIEGKVLHGAAHDEAARAWQEYSGHASCGNSGLFGTAADMAKFCRLWSENGQRILTREEIETALNDTVIEENPEAQRGWGWQLDATFYMSERAPRNSCGHAGFTGPTLWLNRSTRDVCVILNNRVHPTRNGPERFPTHRKIARLLLGS
jgi:CubicO group peptidase (beta-lactamase class C family)